jgi:HK97 family phage major capsid protein
MSMSLAEARSEIKTRLEKADILEKKYDDPATMPAEDQQEVIKLLTEVDGIEAQLATLENAEQRRERIVKDLERFKAPAPNASRPQYGDDGKPPQESPGTQFVKNREYRELKQQGIFNSALARVEFSVPMSEGTSLLQWADMLSSKTLLRGGSSSSGQAFVLEDHQPGFLDILQREINILDLVPRIPTSSDTVEYVREDTFTNAAAFTAEATGFTATALGGSGVKPESALAYSTQTATVRTLAHWIPVTNRMLADAPSIRGVIDSRLLLGLMLTLEGQVATGAGTGEDLTGFLSAPGIGVVGKGADNIFDALYKGRTLVRNTGHGRPSAFLLNPTDWQTIRLSRETSATGVSPGGYLMGPPSMAAGSTLWGLPVVESEVLTQGTAVVADWRQAMTLFDREEGNVRAGTINDQFIKNMQTLLAELRVAFVVWRPSVIAKITGL